MGVAVLAATPAGCSAQVPSAVRSAPVLTVATGLYPLAFAASMVGQGKVAVMDVVPAGSDPLTFQPSASSTTKIRAARVVLEVGGGFQPGFEAAAAGAADRVRLGQDGADSYVWLDPPAMGRMVASVASAMEQADPAAAPLYRRNAVGLQAEISSLGIDYSSTLSACPGRVLVTADDAFSAMASDYGITDQVVGPAPPPAAVAGLVETIRSREVRSILSEPWVDDTGVEAVASAARVPARRIDTLAGPPEGGFPDRADYFAVMEQDLSVLSSVLGCGPATQ